MRKIIPLCAVFCCALFHGLPGDNCLAASLESGSDVIDFNSNWRFIKADPSASGMNPATADFTDSAWETVSAPHTFKNTDTFVNWLVTEQFNRTSHKIKILGQSMTLFTRTRGKETSVTLGANVEATNITQANMYLIFCKAIPSTND